MMCCWSKQKVTAIVSRMLWCEQAAGSDADACDIVPTARVLVLLTDGRVDSYQVLALPHECGALQCELFALDDPQPSCSTTTDVSVSCATVPTTLTLSAGSSNLRPARLTILMIPARSHAGAGGRGYDAAVG